MLKTVCGKCGSDTFEVFTDVDNLGMHFVLSCSGCGWTNDRRFITHGLRKDGE